MYSNALYYPNTLIAATNRNLFEVNRLNVASILLFLLEEPQPSEHCPRKHGYFGHEEANICDKFYYCVDGKFNMITCPSGLVYNDKAGICSWPDEAKKKGCSSKGKISFSSFNCFCFG